MQVSIRFKKNGTLWNILLFGVYIFRTLTFKAFRALHNPVQLHLCVAPTKQIVKNEAFFFIEEWKPLCDSRNCFFYSWKWRQNLFFHFTDTSWRRQHSGWMCVFRFKQTGPKETTIYKVNGSMPNSRSSCQTVSGWDTELSPECSSPTSSFG